MYDMKLKYYMRGLGIGIILTTLIFSIIKTDEKLSDKQIMQRARALGMVTEEEKDAGLEQLLNNNKPTGTENPSEVPSDEPSLAPTKAPVDEPSLGPTKAPEVSLTPTPTVEPTPEPTIAPTEMPDQVIQPNEISFMIKKGMASGEVANLLVEVGLIEDAKAFNQYIVYQGKESIIRIGSYTLPHDASYDDIINEITAKQ